MMKWLYHLRWLLWKNWLVKKRRWMESVWEIVIPLIAVSCLLVLRSQVDVVTVQSKLLDNPFYQIAVPLDSMSPLLYSLTCGCDRPAINAAIATNSIDPFAALSASPLAGKRRPKQQLGVAPRNKEDKLTVQLMVLEWATLMVQFVNRYSRHRFIHCYCDDKEPMTNIQYYIQNRLFKVFDDAAAVESYTQQDEYDLADDIIPLYAAIIIDKPSGLFSEWDWRYTIRMNSSDVPSTTAKTNPLQNFDNITYFTYLASGYLGLQYMIESSALLAGSRWGPSGSNSRSSSNNDTFIEFASPSSFTSSSTSRAPSGLSFSPQNPPFYNLHPFPEGVHESDPFASYLSSTFGLFVVITYLWPFSRMVRAIVDEQERRLREGLCIVGVQPFVIWIAWIITYAIVFVALSTGAVLMTTYGGLFAYSNGLLVFIVLQSFVLTLISGACLLSVFFSKAKTAGMLSPFILLVSFLPYFAVSSDNVPLAYKFLTSLLSPVAFSLSMVQILQLESAFVGLNWWTINTVSPSGADSNAAINNMSVSDCVGMLLLDAVLYSFLATYADLVVKKEYGMSWPWYFPCQLSTYQDCGDGCRLCFQRVKHTTQLSLRRTKVRQAGEGGLQEPTRVQEKTKVADEEKEKQNRKEALQAPPIDMENVDMYESVSSELESQGGIHVRDVVRDFETDLDDTMTTCRRWFCGDNGCFTKKGFCYRKFRALKIYIKHKRAEARRRAGHELVLTDEPQLDEEEDEQEGEDENEWGENQEHEGVAPGIDSSSLTTATRPRSRSVVRGVHRAVNKLNLDMYAGQIFVLLGKNGAGKSTTINMLSGMLSPTSGTIYMFEYDLSIPPQLEAARKEMALCPQYNTLWDELTVAQHLTLFARIKQIDTSSIEARVNMAIEEVGLQEKRDVLSNVLSGGQKRRLCLAMAMIGDSRVVFLDEPTSGVDAFSRRAIWDLLSKKKQDRVIILTTHFLDEAETLADRVAIMHDGELQCCGTPLFLKTRYNLGYNVVITLNLAASASSLSLVSPSSSSSSSSPLNQSTSLQEIVTGLHQFVLAYAPESILVAAEHGEVSFRIPFSSSSHRSSFASSSSSVLPSLLRALDESREQLYIDAYGVSATTLEQVFLRTGELMVTLSNPNSRTGSKKSVSNSNSKSAATSLVNSPAPQHQSITSATLAVMTTSTASLPPTTATRSSSSTRDTIQYNSSNNNNKNKNKTKTKTKIKRHSLTDSLLQQSVASNHENEVEWNDDEEEIVNDVVNGTGANKQINGNNDHYTLLSVNDSSSSSLPPSSSSSSFSSGCHSCADSLKTGCVNCGLRCSSIPCCCCAARSSLSCLCCSHTATLFTKRVHVAKRDGRALMCQLLLPCVLLCLGFALLRIPPDYHFPSLTLQPEQQYNRPNYVEVSPWATWLTSNVVSEEATCLFQDATTDLGVFANTLLQTKVEFGPSRYGAYFIPPATPPSSSAPYPVVYHALVNVTAVHGQPTFISLANQALLRNITHAPTAKLYGTLQPFSWTKSQRTLVNTMNAIFASIVMSLALAFIPASYAVFIVAERENRSHQLQRLSGAHPLAYWVANYLWDLLMFGVAAACFILIVYLYGNPNFIGPNLTVVSVALLLFGLAVIPFTYLCTFAFETATTAQNVMILVYVVTGIVMTIVAFALYLIPKTRQANRHYVRHLFRVFPCFCLADTILYMSIRTLPFFEQGRWDWDVSGYDCLFLAVESVVYFVLVLVVDRLRHTPKFRACFSHDAKVASPDRSVIDPAVEDERLRLAPSSPTNSSSQLSCSDTLQLRGLRKTFAPNKIAVDDVWLGVPKGQCVGYLGVNGAGKSTTLKILTGDLLPTSGSCIMDGIDIHSSPSPCISLCDSGRGSVYHPRPHYLIGYVPQFDALHPLLTGYETLLLHGRLRMLSEDVLQQQIRGLSEQLGLQRHLHRPSYTYSGGTKRKLSVALALIGSPPIVLLDEPSSGMDPISRRQLWTVLQHYVRSSCMLLTSHSMEECEALCHRVAIISGGALQCIGSVQQLKTKFGGSYQLSVTLKHDSKIRRKSSAAAAIVTTPPLSSTLAAPAVAASCGPSPSSCSPSPSPPTSSSPPAAPVPSSSSPPSSSSSSSSSSSLSTSFSSLPSSSSSSSLSKSFRRRRRRLFEFVQNEFGPDVQLQQVVGGNHFAFEVSIATCRHSLASMFEKMENEKKRLEMRDYAIGQTTLEQVFVKLAKQADEQMHAAVELQDKKDADNNKQYGEKKVEDENEDEAAKKNEKEVNGKSWSSGLSMLDVLNEVVDENEIEEEEEDRLDINYD